MFGCECFISAKSIHSSLLLWRGQFILKLKDQIQNYQNRSSGEKSNRIYETYINTVMPHGRHIYAKSYNMEKAKMCTYPQSDNAFPHWEYLLICCVKHQCVNIPEQETYDKYSDTTPSIRFYIYYLIARCAVHGRLPLNDKGNFRMCKQYYVSEQSTKIYTRKALVMMETTISNFCKNFYIPEIQKFAFHLPHVRILGTNHCGESR